jgi:hypothetical protein
MPESLSLIPYPRCPHRNRDATHPDVLFVVAVGNPDVAVGDCGLTSQMPRRYRAKFLSAGVAGGGHMRRIGQHVVEIMPVLARHNCDGLRCCPSVSGLRAGRISRRRSASPDLADWFNGRIS